MYQKAPLAHLARLDDGSNVVGQNVRLLFNAITDEQLSREVDGAPAPSEPLLLGPTLAVADSTADGAAVRRAIVRLVKVGSWELFEQSPAEFERNHEDIIRQLQTHGFDGIILAGPADDPHLRQFYYCFDPRRCVAAYLVEYQTIEAGLLDRPSPAAPS
jgi:hypothetical protein